MIRQLIPRVCALIVVGMVLVLPLVARAQDPNVTAADAAYRRGADAYDAGNYPVAAAEFAQADSLAPNLTALEFALKAALKSDDPLLAMSLADRARKRDFRLDGLVRELKQKFGSRVGRILIRCPQPCTASVDGETMPVGQSHWLLVGPHDVEIDASGSKDRRTITLAPDQTMTLDARPVERRPSVHTTAPPAEIRHDTGRRGVSPAFFWGGLGATALFGAATIASGLDTKSRHDAFTESPSDSAASEGRSAQLRTNVLLVGTAVLAVATGAVGTFVVDW